MLSHSNLKGGKTTELWAVEQDSADHTLPTSYRLCIST